MTLAHFGFSKTGDIIDNDQLPISLSNNWREDEENNGRPFPTFARLLSQRGTNLGESRYSWTVDFTARRAKAREEMAPHLAEVEKLKLHIVEQKEQLKALKKEKAAPKELDALKDIIKSLEKSAREAQVKADAIDAAVYDLKAVNPNAVIKVDTRTPAEIIGSIEEQERIVTAALTKLKTLLAEKGISA